MPIGRATTIGGVDSAVLQGFGTEVGIGVPRQRDTLRQFVDKAHAALLEETSLVIDECYRDEGEAVTRAMASFDEHHAVLQQTLR